MKLTTPRRVIEPEEFEIQSFEDIPRFNKACGYDFFSSWNLKAWKNRFYSRIHPVPGLGVLFYGSEKPFGQSRDYRIFLLRPDGRIGFHSQGDLTLKYRSRLRASLEFEKLTKLSVAELEKRFR